MKIREEQKKLAEERDEIDQILKSKARLTKLVREELLQDAEDYGDARRTKLVEREAAQAICRSGAVDQRADHGGAFAAGLGARREGTRYRRACASYKSGDEFQAAAKGRNLQQAVFIDSTAGPTAWMRISCRRRAAMASRCPAPSILPTARRSPRCSSGNRTIYGCSRAMRATVFR